MSSRPELDALIDDFDRSARMYAGASIAIAITAAVFLIVGLVPNHPAMLSETLKAASPILGTTGVLPFNNFIRTRERHRTLAYIRLSYAKERLSTRERARLDDLLETILRGMITNV
jgi:hypothetical protein